MRNNPGVIAEKLIAKYRRTAPLAAEQGIIPYRSEDGKWIASPHVGNSWWTGGFWPGLMWQLYSTTEDPFFKEEATKVSYPSSSKTMAMPWASATSSSIISIFTLSRSSH